MIKPRLVYLTGSRRIKPSTAIVRGWAAAATSLALAVSGCAGDDGERKRAEAAEWCDVTLRHDQGWDDRDGSRAFTVVMSLDGATEWIEVAPEDIRSATERAARILQQASHQQNPRNLVEARKEIGAYAAEYCPTPARCIADVEGNPTLPCIN